MSRARVSRPNAAGSSRRKTAGASPAARFIPRHRASAPLVRGPHHHEAAVVAGHGALDQQQVVLGVDANDVEVADRDALVAVAAGHALALLGPAAAAVAGVRADAAGGA